MIFKIVGSTTRRTREDASYRPNSCETADAQEHIVTKSAFEAEANGNDELAFIFLGVLWKPAEWGCGLHHADHLFVEDVVIRGIDDLRDGGELTLAVDGNAHSGRAL